LHKQKRNRSKRKYALGYRYVAPIGSVNRRSPAAKRRRACSYRIICLTAKGTAIYLNLQFADSYPEKLFFNAAAITGQERIE